MNAVDEGPPREPAKAGLFPLRKRTGTANFHLSKEAVDFGFDDLEQLTPRRASDMLAKIRWGSTTEMSCPHCGCIDTHYWSAKELRWKCKSCGKRFSVTSGTVFAGHRLPLAKIIKVIFSWANGASGKPALQLRRDWNVSYPTVFTLLHKCREGLMRGFNTGVLCGIEEMDGMDVNGRRYREKRNKPQVSNKGRKPELPSDLLKAQQKVNPETGEIMGPPVPPKHGKTARQHPDRRLMLVMRQRSRSVGKGGVHTRVAIAVTESSATVKAMATKFASVESTIMSDEDPSYASFKRLFEEHHTINHSVAYSYRDGTNNNQAESFNWRMRRSVEGIYLNPSNRHLLAYASEAAWREDTRRLSTGKKLHQLLSVAMNVGPSIWWTGYSHGRHRKEELLIEGPKVTAARGKKPGAKAKPPK